MEKFHTQLASTYLDRLLQPNARADEALRQRFRNLIVQSTLIRPNFLLSRLEKTDLEQEKAILHGKVRFVCAVAMHVSTMGTCGKGETFHDAWYEFRVYYTERSVGDSIVIVQLVLSRLNCLLFMIEKKIGLT